MRTSRITALCTLLIALGASSLSAQEAQERQGFWIGGGMGYGSLGTSCDGCGSIDREGGLSGYLKLGGTLRPNVLLGVETNGWTKDESGARLTMGNVSGAAYWYPAAASGLFVKGGAGYAFLHASASGVGDTESGLGLLTGVGYDLRVGRNLSLTPVANWFYGNFSGGSSNVIQIGLGVTAH